MSRGPSGRVTEYGAASRRFVQPPCGASLAVVAATPAALRGFRAGLTLLASGVRLRPRNRAVTRLTSGSGDNRCSALLASRRRRSARRIRRPAARRPASRAAPAARSRGSPRRPARGSGPASRRGSRAGSRRRPSRCPGCRPGAAARRPTPGATIARTRSGRWPRSRASSRPLARRAVRTVAVIVRSGPVRAGRPAVGQLVGRHQPRPDRDAEVLALGRPQPERALVALEVARGPVVEHEEPADGLLAALVGRFDDRRVDQRADLQLVVQLDRARAAPRRARPARAAPTRWRSRRSAAGTRPPGSPGRGAPTSCRTWRSNA